MIVKLNESNSANITKNMTVGALQELAKNGTAFVLADGKIAEIEYNEETMDDLSQFLPQDNLIEIFKQVFREIYKSLQTVEQIAARLARYWYDNVLQYEDGDSLELTEEFLSEFNLPDDVKEDIMDKIKEELELRKEHDTETGFGADNLEELTEEMDDYDAYGKDYDCDGR